MRRSFLCFAVMALLSTIPLQASAEFFAFTRKTSNDKLELQFISARTGATVRSLRTYDYGQLYTVQPPLVGRGSQRIFVGSERNDTRQRIYVVNWIDGSIRSKHVASTQGITLLPSDDGPILAVSQADPRTGQILISEVSAEAGEVTPRNSLPSVYSSLWSISPSEIRGVDPLSGDLFIEKEVGDQNIVYAMDSIAGTDRELYRIPAPLTSKVVMRNRHYGVLLSEYRFDFSGVEIGHIFFSTDMSLPLHQLMRTTGSDSLTGQTLLGNIYSITKEGGDQLIYFAYPEYGELRTSRFQNSQENVIEVIVP